MTSCSGTKGMDGRPSPIGAKISWPFSGSPVFVVAHGDFAGAKSNAFSDRRWMAAEQWPAVRLRAVAATSATHRAVSGGVGPVWRVLERIYQRFEQQDHQQMRQDEGSGRAWILARWSLQSNDALQSLESQFNAPSQSIQGQHILGVNLVLSIPGIGKRSALSLIQNTGRADRSGRLLYKGAAPLKTAPSLPGAARA